MSETIVGNIHMSTRHFGHDCTFTWRLRNLSLLQHCLKSKTKPIAKRDFTLHPTCDARWCIKFYSVCGGYEARVSRKPTNLCFSEVTHNIGLLNPKGDLVLPNNPDKVDDDDEDDEYNVIMVLKIRLGEENTVIIGDGVVVELEDDTLVVGWRIDLRPCCMRTEIDKEETTVVPKTTNPLDYCQLVQDGFVVA